MKTTGQLAHGWGIVESQRTQWLLSVPACADLNGAKQEATDTEYLTSEQHKYMTKARQTKDNNDTNCLLEFLLDRNPFCADANLHNIATCSQHVQPFWLLVASLVRVVAMALMQCPYCQYTSAHFTDLGRMTG